MVIHALYVYFVSQKKKMENHNYLICLGSNSNKEFNLSLAERELSARFPSIVFGTQMETAPLLIDNPALFTNQLARFTSHLSLSEIKKICKEIESLAGRTPEDKGKNIVKLDIDLLMIGGKILKPNDMEREYIKKGMEELF